MNKIRRIVGSGIFCCVMLALLSAPLEAHATQSLRKELGKAVAVLSDVIITQKQSQVGLGTIDAPPGVTTAPLIRLILREEFEKRKITVAITAADLNVKVEFRSESPEDKLAKEDGQPAVRFNLQLVDRAGRQLTDLQTGAVKDDNIAVEQGKLAVRVPGEETYVAVLQPQVTIPSDMSAAERKGILASAVSGQEDPPVILGTVVFAGKNSPYGVEILVNGMPRMPEAQGKEIFVPIQRGEKYKIRLVNNTAFEAASKVLIDGLSTFAFSELRHKDGERKGQPLYDTWIVSPRSGADVPGWHKRDQGPDNINAFQVTKYADSAAALVQQEQELGTITVSFAAAWPATEDPPAALNEPGVRRKGLPDATGIGAPETVGLKPVERTIGVVRANVRIRYSKPAPSE